MIIHLRDLPEGHSEIEREGPSEGLGLEKWVTPRGPIHVVLDADRRNLQITLRGEVELEAEHSCDRCLQKFQAPLVAPIMVFSDRRGSDDLRDEVVLEQEGSVLYHDGKELNLEDPFREALILEIPQIVLCRPECAGLCSECGQDLNKKVCDCKPSQGDPRWAALRNLKDRKPDASP